MKLIIICSIFFIWLFLLPNSALGQSFGKDQNQFITIVNPVRLSSYTKDSAESLKAQYFEIKSRDLPASWLFTYDVLENPDVVSFAKQMDKQQDLGIFLEVTPNFSKASGVTYNKTDSWHRSNSVFLIGYTQENRKKFIDIVFEKFKENFGYYPKSVGAWWVDSFSLRYMKDKYGITSTLGCADQFYTDGYSLWGQYWSTPYYPSKNHAGIPARTLENKLDIVTLQWAARDPFNGYSGERASSYSTQDYYTRSLPDEYYENLIKLYALKNKNQFGQITLGLEGDFPGDTYKGLYAKQLDIIKKISIQEGITVTNMKDFSTWYRKTFTNLSPSHLIETDDLLGSKIRSIWYQSPVYRIGLNINKETNELRFVDWRVYQDNFQEPFFLTPNTELNLYINIPSLIDQISDPKSIWSINTKGTFSTKGDSRKYSLYFDDKPLITFDEGGISLFETELPNFLGKTNLLKLARSNGIINITTAERWPTNEEGVTFRGLPPEFFYFTNTYNLSKPTNIKRLSVVFFVFVTVLFLAFKYRLFNKKFSKKIIVAVFLGGILIVILRSRIYSVSQAEIDALLHLRSQEPGKIVVFDETCLKCKWTNRYMPAAFANNRGYVSEVTGKPTVYNRSIFVAESRPMGKKILDGLVAKYIYIVKYENYMEKLPFSPGDYNVELIFENANAQVWRIKS